MDHDPVLFGKLTFREAAKRWHQARKRDFRKARAWEIYSYYFGIANYDPSFEEGKSKRTIGDNHAQDRRLAAFFGDMRLTDIHIGNFEKYEEWRQQSASPSTVNRELNALLQVMEAAGLRRKIELHYSPLPVAEPGVPRILTPEEEEYIFQVAATDPAWALAYWVLSLANNTAAGPKELRILQRKHVDMQKRMIYVPDDAAKNKYRVRHVPLNDRAFIQMDRILRRARELGSHQPEHYIFPFKVSRNRYDATRSASESFIKKQLHALRAAVNMPDLTAYWFRHTAITKMYEDPETSEETVRHIAGHHSQKIKETYSHSRTHVMRSALDRLSDRNRAQVLEGEYRKTGRFQPRTAHPTRGRQGA